MTPRPIRSRRPRSRARLRLALCGTVAATLLASLYSGLGSAQAVTNPVTPGTYTGPGFDQCDAPSSTAMDAWMASSPYRAAGIYISGYSRACRTQSNLTPTWVAHQLANGWHLMPITLGPQASCSTRFPRYGWNIDPTINPDSTSNYAQARSQGSTTADQAVQAAQALGIVPGSTLFYDLEGFNNGITSCRESAKAFLSAWTDEVRTAGYLSGVYSSASSGIVMLEQARAAAQPGNSLPDQIWIAEWNGQANTDSAYIGPVGWSQHQRAHQYRGGHNETYGGVTINIDTDYVDLVAPGSPAPPPTTSPTPTPSPSPAPTPTAAPGPAPTTGTYDPACTSASISRPAYTYTDATHGAANVTALQCLLKQQHLYNYAVTGQWNSQTLAAVQAWQQRVHHRVGQGMTRSDYVAILSAGNSGRVFRYGASGADVIRVQRAMNAALWRRLAVTGHVNRATAGAIAAYKKRFGLYPSGVVYSRVWSLLTAGRL